MEKIKLSNGVLLEFTDIKDKSNTVIITFNGLELADLRTLFDEPINLSSIEVLTEGDVICAIYEGHNKVDKYVIEEENITVIITKPDEILTKLNKLEDDNAMLTECILEMSELLYV